MPGAVPRLMQLRVAVTVDLVVAKPPGVARIGQAGFDVAHSKGPAQVVGDAEAPLDEHLLAALEYGLPDCSGVALGVDRLLMLCLNVDDIGMVLSFPYDRA